MSFTEFKEHNVRAGLGTALAVMKPNETKYHILAAVESLPAVFGTPENISYSSTTNMSVTNVKGKNTTENVSVNIPYNLDNINLMDEINGLRCKFAYIDLDDFSGQEFVATPSYHMAEVGTSAIKTIILDLSVEDAKAKITQDLYDLFQDTISFEATIPGNLTINGTGKEELNVSVTPSSATVTVESSATGVATATYESGKLTITGVAAGSTIVTIKANDSTNEYAANSRKIKVIVE